MTKQPLNRPQPTVSTKSLSNDFIFIPYLLYTKCSATEIALHLSLYDTKVYFSSAIKRYANAPIIAPKIGATQNNHNCSIAQEPWNNATPVERAGFTEVLVTGIEIR